jgi:ketosteroid isomerase-like protein
MKANAKTEAAVTSAMNKFREAYRNRDLDGLLKLIARDDDIFMFGTGPDEKRIGVEQFKFQAKRDWSQIDALDFNLTWQQISAAGPVAWVAADGQGEGRVGDQKFAFPMRMTAVLEQRGDEWLFVQMHVSTPAPDQEAGDSLPM